MYKQYLSTQKGSVITTVQIPINTRIIDFSGKVLLDREIDSSTINDHWQVGPNSFLAPSGNAEDYLKHSCEPNCLLHVVGNRAILVSMYTIPAGTELTVDYATTSTDSVDAWKMDCNCGSSKCRKTISGHQYLDADTRQKYLDKGALPLFITSPEMFYRI